MEPSSRLLGLCRLYYTDENNILNFDEWYFVNYANDERVYPGNIQINVNGYANLQLNTYTIDLSQPTL